MARIVVGSYLVQFPLGGYLSWVLQWLLGFHQLGHDVTFVEKASWPDACFDPVQQVMSDDCSHGVRMLDAMMARFGMAGRWCFVDIASQYHGLSRPAIESVLDSADLFVDMGAHGSWLPEAQRAGLRVLIDGEPGATQIKMQKKLEAGETLPDYDFYYTVGLDVGTAAFASPSAGKPWRPIVDPVVMELFPVAPPPPDAPFTTVMSWQAHEPLAFRGQVYGQKDVEFMKFLDLPRLTGAPLEIAVSGNVPRQHLQAAGWQIKDAHAESLTLNAFWQYIAGSAGEFSVCKNVYVATHSGFFSERAAAYLASGRPVVMQDTGFSRHLPCGRGLFAMRTVEEAAAAIDEIRAGYERHSAWARAVAAEHLATARVLPRFLSELGV